MTAPRNQLIPDDLDCVVHCYNRCCRGMFLCGYDTLTQKDYSYRKDWIRDRLIKLSDIFAIQITGYAIMENHLHVLLKIDKEKLNKMTDLEVARRWKLLCPPRRIRGKPCILTKKELKILTNDKKTINKWRKRLGSISWFMKSLDEYIAKRANKEDGTKGHFWQGRYQSTLALDEPATLTLSMYVDLNPIRSKKVDVPEKSEFTSVYDRIKSENAKKIAKNLANKRILPKKIKKELTQDKWLAPLFTNNQQKGILSINFDQYLTLLEWTGKQVREDKRGAIPSNITPILERLKLKADAWIDNFMKSKKVLHRALGHTERIREYTTSINQRWLHGISAIRNSFF